LPGLKNVPKNQGKNRMKILLAHGSGGRLTQDLIRNLLIKRLGNPTLNQLCDSAVICLANKRLAFTTDSFVVSPLFFKGGDIGKLSICGTINDLLMAGAVPKFISLGIIIEEGLEYSVFERIVDSIALTAKREKVLVVTGDLKVVERGACDKIFINTSGVGNLIPGVKLAAKFIQPGDKIIITGRIAEHGLSIFAGRKDSGLDFNIKSDCAALGSLLIPLLQKNFAVRFMRDPTRGGLSAALNEIAQACSFDIMIEERKIPISGRIKAVCELLGMSPLGIANEGKALLIVNQTQARRILVQLKKHSLGRYASVIGRVLRQTTGRVLLKTTVGSVRILPMPVGDNLPRIC
jgi:hydrogenase expression/formation protein HypE